MIGYWAVMETGQGGGLPDHIHGPFYDEQEAATERDRLAAEAAAVGRRDRFEAVECTPTEEDL